MWHGVGGGCCFLDPRLSPARTLPPPPLPPPLPQPVQEVARWLRRPVAEVSDHEIPLPVAGVTRASPSGEFPLPFCYSLVDSVVRFSAVFIPIFSSWRTQGDLVRFLLMPLSAAANLLVQPPFFHCTGAQTNNSSLHLSHLICMFTILAKSQEA